MSRKAFGTQKSAFSIASAHPHMVAPGLHKVAVRHDILEATHPLE